MTTELLMDKILSKQKLFRKLDPKSIESKSIEKWLELELTYTSNALEGNTLTRQETKTIITDGISIGGKNISEIYEAQNHAKALVYIQNLAKTIKPSQITENIILQIYSIILSNIDNENASRYRNVRVRIAGSSTILPNFLKVPELMIDFVKLINKTEINIKDLLSLAIISHYQLVTIHPFVDGNGRTARLLFNLILLINQFPITYISKEDRSKYLTYLENAQNGGSYREYEHLMLLAIDRSLDLYIGKDQMETKTTLLISELAKITNENISTIRYWTKEGLLSVFMVKPNGYAMYSFDSIDQIKTIRNLKSKNRLTISEIKELLNK